ncbi:3-deoxy-manno-octulosonate cytidylyltransferase [hydrothermal vent metagenome]|uniref:3-deoxy-manno-octulosonate cytidylyltransferase n=1 Tax=hydrothermal vent metagenome TaxID=652676 RepID=A0A3B1BXM9_9ZZZZ
MIQRVYEQAKKMATASRVIVATDDSRIYAAVTKFRGEAWLTSIDHQSGTDRIAEVARELPDYDIVVNIQGDEPFIDPAAVDEAVRGVADDPSLNVSTLCVAMGKEQAGDTNVTCVVRDLRGYALYFSKAMIPNDRDGDCDDLPLYKHLGTYVYRRDFLLKYATMKRTPLEKCEKLEQLRILEHGEKILCIETPSDSIGVDSPEDLEAAEKIAGNG